MSDSTVVRVRCAPHEAAPATTSGDLMSDPALQTTIRIMPDAPHVRRALLPSGTTLLIGETMPDGSGHSGDGVDCTGVGALVAAVGASLVGVFAHALASQGIATGPGTLSATAVGTVEIETRVPVLREIAVTYYVAERLGAGLETLAAIRRYHADASPVYRSIHPQIRVSTLVETV